MGSNYIRSSNKSYCIGQLREEFGLLLEDDTKGWASEDEWRAASLACSKDLRWAHADWKKYIAEAKSRYPQSLDTVHRRIEADIREAEEWEATFDGIWASITLFFGN